MIGPQLPATAAERGVAGDQLREAGFTPPWPAKEKATSVLGAEIAARAAKAMSTIATHAAVLAELELKRRETAAAVEAARGELEALGIDSFSELARIEHSEHYPACVHPTCQRVSKWRWDPQPWHCHEHQPPKAEPEAVPAPKLAVAK